MRVLANYVVFNCMWQKELLQGSDWPYTSLQTAVQRNCLISYVGGLSTSLSIMGLVTIDPHSVKEHTKVHKIPKFDLNRPNNKQDTAI